MPSIAWGDLDTAIAPVPGWRFYVTLPDLTGLSVSGQVLSFLVQKFVGSSRGVDYEQVPYNAGQRNFPIGYHFDNLSITFIEDQKFSVFTYLDAWTRLVVSDSGVFGLPAKYKMPISIDALDETGATIKSFAWTLCSPVKPEPFDWDGTQSSYLMTSCGFAVDVPLVTGTSVGGIAGSVGSTITGSGLTAAAGSSDVGSGSPSLTEPQYGGSVSYQ